MDFEKDAKDFSMGLAERVTDCLPDNVSFAFFLFDRKEDWVSCVTSCDREELKEVLISYIEAELYKHFSGKAH